MTPDLAVVIPAFGRPGKTRRAVRSALAQAGMRLEVIVVDDASPEPFEAPRELAEAGLRVLRLPENGGPAAARNAGVAASRAPFIAFLDSDDFFLPGTLAPRLAMLRDLSSRDRPLLLAAAVWRWLPGRSAEESRPSEAESLAALASGCWYFPGSTSLFSRATWDRVGPLDARLRRLEDLDWGIRLGLAGGALRVAPEPAAVIERSPRAGLAKVSAAADALLTRYAAGGNQPLERAALSRLKAYLALEKASSALGERRMARFAAELAASFLQRPRLSLHQAQWWSTRPGSATELRAIEDMAKALEA